MRREFPKRIRSRPRNAGLRSGAPVTSRRSQAIRHAQERHPARCDRHRARSPDDRSARPRFVGGWRRRGTSQDGDLRRGVALGTRQARRQQPLRRVSRARTGGKRASQPCGGHRSQFCETGRARGGARGRWSERGGLGRHCDVYERARREGRARCTPARVTCWRAWRELEIGPQRAAVWERGLFWVGFGA